MFIGAGFGLLNDSALFSTGLYETQLMDSSCVVPPWLHSGVLSFRPKGNALYLSDFSNYVLMVQHEIKAK
jgi:hypothetical protein